MDIFILKTVRWKIYDFEPSEYAANRMELYAKVINPNRCSGESRNWSKVGDMEPNIEKKKQLNGSGNKYVEKRRLSPIG